MKMNLKLVLGILIVIIIVASAGIMLSSGDESDVTGAVVGTSITAGGDCPTGDNFQTLSQCKAWKESGVKSSELKDVPNDLMDSFCNNVLNMYPNC